VVQFRALIQRSSTAKLVCLVVVILFVLVCGIHVAGAHHDGDADGLSLGDSSAAAILAIVLLMGFALLVSLRSGSDDYGTWPARSLARIRSSHPVINVLMPLRR
jgi:hypothetical protein